MHFNTDYSLKMFNRENKLVLAFFSDLNKNKEK